MKNLLLIIALSSALPCLGSFFSHEPDAYPFVDQPKLSWAEFEETFKAKYRHLNILPITVTTDYTRSPAAYN